jgi:hypothetical protein
MQSSTRRQIHTLVSEVISKKIENYERESSYIPFAAAMFGEAAVATGSILQSLYTTFGMSTFEQIAVILARGAGYHAEHQYQLLGTVDATTARLIDRISRQSEAPNTAVALNEIRGSIKPGQMLKDRESVVDVFIRKGKQEIYIDIASAKPNKKEFQALREKLLRWYALRLSQGHISDVRACIGIPYNPYHPRPYTRWTGACCDPKTDLLVQKDFWALVAGEDVFDDLLEIFQEVGKGAEKEIKRFLLK